MKPNRKKQLSPRFEAVFGVFHGLFIDTLLMVEIRVSFGYNGHVSQIPKIRKSSHFCVLEGQS